MDPKADVVAYMKSIKDYTEAKAIWEKVDAAHNNCEISEEDWLKAKVIWHDAETKWHKIDSDWNKTNAALHKSKIGPAKEAALKSYMLSTVTKSKLKEVQMGEEGSVKMVTRLPDEAPTQRTWNFRDDNKQHFHGDIPTQQETISLTLNWKRDSEAQPLLVGKYKIDLPALVKAEHVCVGNRGYVLRFQRTGANIEIAINRNSPVLVIGKVPIEN